MGWKWILGIVAAVIVALLVTIYVVLSTYDFNKLKPEIVHLVKETTGRDLTLGGDIELDIGLAPALVVEDVSFQNAPWGSRPQLAKIKRLEVQVALFPLIRGDIRLNRLILVEPDLFLETNESGKWNVDFEKAQKTELPEAGQAKEMTGLRLPALILNQVRIEKGKLTYRDGKSGRTYAVTLERLSLTEPHKESPLKLDLNGVFNEKTFRATGTLGPLVTMMDPEEISSINLDMAMGSVRAKVEGGIKDIMKGRGLDLKMNAEGPSLLDIAHLANVGGVPDMGPFRVQVKITDPEGKLTLERLTVQAGTQELAEVRLTGSVKDPLAGRGIKLNFAVRGRDLGNLEKLVGRPVALKGPFEVSGRIEDPAAKTYKLTGLEGTFAESDLNGWVQLGLTDKRPRLKAALSSKRLDLRMLLSKKGQNQEEGGESGNKPGKQKRLFPQEPLPFDRLKAIDANVNFHGGKVLLPALALDELSAQIIIENGRLTLDPLKSLVGGGTLAGRIDLRPEADSAILTTSLEVHQVDLGSMLKELGVEEITEGKLDGEIDVNGRGGSVASLMGGLNGKIVVVMGKGRIHSKYVDLLGAELGTSAINLLNPFRDKGHQAQLNCLVLRFDIKDGIAKTNPFVFDTDLMSVVGDGKINLKTEALDLSIHPSPKKGVGISGIGQIGLSLGELAKPLKMSGTLANPSLAIDATQTAITLGKAVGGVMLFGPAGIAAALASGSVGEKNPCLEAIEAAKEGVEAKPKPEEKGQEEKASQGVTEDVQETIEGVGKGLKRLFGQ